MAARGTSTVNASLPRGYNRSQFGPLSVAPSATYASPLYALPIGQQRSIRVAGRLLWLVATIANASGHPLTDS
jgi:hypothetical protein